MSAVVVARYIDLHKLDGLRQALRPFQALAVRLADRDPDDALVIDTAVEEDPLPLMVGDLHSLDLAATALFADDGQ